MEYPVEKHPQKIPDTGEKLTTDEIIEAFKKALALREDGYYPSFENVQEALRIFLSHIQAINPSYALFSRSVLNRYNTSIMEVSFGNEFLWLQGYIRYIQKRILGPLEWTPLRWVKIDFHASKEQIKENIRVACAALQDIEKIQESLALILTEMKSTNTENLGKEWYEELRTALMIQEQNCSEIKQKIQSSLHGYQTLLIELTESNR